ncbi:MAG TPA: alpha/beta fold hydrolase [Actinomycetota bacterium]|nr:alpha/beta fold hydrolase [Actinomycetota bacterium]
MIVTEEGPPDADAVVLLHGWPGGVHTWRRLAPLLATRFRVLTPMLGGTDPVGHAADVRAALAERGVTRFALVGHGHGGAVAQLVADGDPGTEGLVLIDSVAFDVAPPRDLDARTFVERGSVEIADLPAADLDAYAAAPATPPDPVDLTPLTDGMASWDFPVFLLWGEEDPYVPMAVAERLTDACPGATLGVVPDSGHFLLDDAFDPVGVMILEYLRARYQGAPHGHEGVVTLQLERRPPWVDLAPYEEDDVEPGPPAREQEVGPDA